MFSLNANTKIEAGALSTPVKYAVHMLERDIRKVFVPSSLPASRIRLSQKEDMPDESYTISISDHIVITAGDDLGFIYGLLHISETYLGIEPFWFWMDQKIVQREQIIIDKSRYESRKPVIRFRGWFFNDEVLFLKWRINGNQEEVWKMAFEALLRCGGNMTIPGTDKMSRKNRQLAADMGLWITHHHAEPLGAEMFVRAYPDKQPNIAENPELFYQLWEEAVREQKDYKVVWNLCFRGQGDCPFWSTDTSGRFDTPAKRGALISKMIEKQCDIVRKYVAHPIFCTNLYGEIMELYKQGYIKLDSEVIRVRADNGYGKMVTRRQDNHSTRTSSMPDKTEKGPQGIYYHVSFYDLQAANHITMLPNGIDFVNSELNEVIKNGGKDFWVINCSNVRPHVYYLDTIRKKWFGEEVSDKAQSSAYVKTYFNGSKAVERCFLDYPKAMIAYGVNEDEHVGEQFYTENIRLIASQFIRDREKNVTALYWLTGNVSLREQIQQIGEIIRRGEHQLTVYYKMCKKVSEALARREKHLFDNTLYLQTQIHYHCARGVLLFSQAYEKYSEALLKEAFILLGDSACAFGQAAKSMSKSGYGVWEDFYQNECLADIKHTAYMVRKMMGVIRELGDNMRHDKWYRETVYAPEDRNVFLLLVQDNHMTDWELYKRMKEKEYSSASIL